MHPLLSRLAIQSWCFRGTRDHAKIIDSLRACGISAIELCGFHFDPALPADPAPILDLYRRANIAITAYGVERITPHAGGKGRENLPLDGSNIARRIFEFAAQENFPAIVADLAPGGLEIAEKLCTQFNKKIAIHNHGRRHALGSPFALEDLFAKSSPNIGLCLDTAWMIDSGFDPLTIAQQFRSRLYALHIKDFVFTPAGQPQDVVVGQGNLDLPALIRYLVETNWSGSLTLEYEGDVSNPVPALQQCVRAIHDAFAQVTK